ncbi:MAG TPA: hypothetical protein VFB14_27270 [Bryobacteraceae bacterium]|jgi:hypothetical protein|nr:hypothetical protein [Bryobacteraceae bacterium]
MKIEKTFVAAVSITFSLIAVPSANAQCAISPAAFVATASAPNLALPQVQAHSDPGPADAAEDSGRDNASVVGFWKVTFTSGGQVVDQGFGQWHRDRTEILSDTANGPAHGNLCMGAWAKTGPRTYKLNHLGLTFDLNGALAGTTQTRQQITVARGGNTYSGSFTIDFFDLNGNTIAHFDGEIAATRITAD